MRTVRTFVVLAFVAAGTLAGPNRWTTTGPGVGALSRIYVSPADPNTAFVSTAAGIFKTSDGGRTWRSIGVGLPPSASVLAMAPDGSLYAAAGATLFLSDDGGGHWTQRGSPGSVFIFNLVFDATSNNLIVGTSGVAGIFFSADRGATWKPAHVTSASHGVFKGVSSLALSATAAYAIADVDNSMVILRSTDGGQTWNQLKPVPAIGTVYAAPSSDWIYGWTLGSKLFVVSKDEGKTWTEFPLANGANAVVPIGKTLYIGSTLGLFEYDDGSTTGTPLTGTSISALAISSTTPRHYYAAPPTGLMTFTDGDTAWSSDAAGLPGLNASDVDLSRVQPSTAYATTDGGIFRTDDGGQSWAAISREVAPPSYRFPDANRVAVSPTTPNTAYVTGGSGDSTGVFRTVDAGVTWQKVTPDFGRVLAIAPSDPQTLYAALADGMAKSRDGGDVWSSITSNLGTGSYFYYYYAAYPSAIVIDPSSPTSVDIAKPNGIYRTTDGGAQWTQVSIESNLRALAIDPGNPSTFYGSRFTVPGFIRSSDGGRTWNTVGLTDKWITTIALSGSTLFAGTQDSHIYRSDDGGNSWTGFDDGILFGGIARVVADSRGEHLYAATGAGLYSYDVVNQEVVPRRLNDDPRLLPRVLDAILGVGTAQGAWLVPIAGTIRGASGALYTTQLTLSNSRASPQPVLISRVPRPGESDVTSFTVTIPAAGSSGDGALRFADIAERLGISGLGSLLITAVDDSGNFDPNGSIAVSTLIWTFLPDGVAPTSQAIPSAGMASFRPHTHARMVGLQEDSQFRENIGVVNLSTDAHQFTIQITGERASGQITIEVPALSLVQLGLPEADYGQTTIDGIADAADTRWLLYGSSINRSTGQAQTFLGGPLE